jgi:hypothetical protein
MAYVSPKMRNKITVTEEEMGWSVIGSNNKVVVPAPAPAPASASASASAVVGVAGKWAPLPKAAATGPEPLLTRQAFEKKAMPADSGAAPVKKSSYVPPNQRSAEQKAAAKEEPKTFDEAFPELGNAPAAAAAAASAAPTVKSGGWGSKGSGLNAILAAAAPKPIVVDLEDTEEAATVNTRRIRVIDISDREEPEDAVDTAYFAMLRKHNMALNRLHAAQRQRALEQSRRRQPIFDSSSESEKLSVEEDDHYSDYDDNSNEEDGEGETYDPDSFDRHR